MKLFGLIGYPLSHSFSKKFFSEKFERENINDSRYELFEIKEANEVLTIIKQNPELKGLNVTIPHKESVMPFLNHIDKDALEIGAINVIKVLPNGELKGFNSDYYGFKHSLINFLENKATNNYKALILGTGGAAKAVKQALINLGIAYEFVSRKNGIGFLYETLNENILNEYKIIINTTPIGMYPKIDMAPEIPYQYLTSEHYLFDLVYNPVETLFMKKGREQGAHVQNGLEMLQLQAEKAWEIWNN